MLKTMKEPYKTDKERTQLNRLEDIDSHTCFFVSVSKSSFEACYVHWTYAGVEVGVGEPDKKGFSSCPEV